MQLCKRRKLSPGQETLWSSTHQQGKHCYLQWSEWFVTIVSVISRWRETRALIWVLQVIIYPCAHSTTSTSRPGKARSSWPRARCWCLGYQRWTPPLMRTRGDNTTTGLEWWTRCIKLVCAPVERCSWFFQHQSASQTKIFANIDHWQLINK